MTTGDKIHACRIAAGLTQEELAKIVGLQKAAIYKYEKGLVVNLKRDIIEKLSAALGVSPTYLLGLSDDISQPMSNSDSQQPGSPPPEDPVTAEIINAVRSMPAEQQQQVLQFAQYLADRAQK